MAPQLVGTPLAGGTDTARQGARGSNTRNFMRMLAAKGNWNIVRGKLKQQLAQLVGDDLQFIEGKENELVGRVQKRTGRAKEKNKHTTVNCCGCKN